MVSASSGGVSGTQDTTVPGGTILCTAGAPCCSTGVTGAPGSTVVGAASGDGGAGRAGPDSAADSSQAVNTPSVPTPTASRNPRRSTPRTVTTQPPPTREPDGRVPSPRTHALPASPCQVETTWTPRALGPPGEHASSGLGS